VPWKAKSPMDLRREFVRRLGENERLSDLCREYGISRKTGHKFKKRFEQQGYEGLESQSRAPKLIPHKTPAEVETIIVAERKLHPTWGGKKLKEVLEKRLGSKFPSASAITAVLSRNGLVEPHKKRIRHTLSTTALRQVTAPNDVWCIDYKGQFRLGDGTYCYPLTITDQFSRFILACEGMAAISDDQAREVCIEIFAEHGLPMAFRSDNGVPFASTGLAGLTRLSALWLRLGIVRERIRPAHPEENGQHERMHRTLKRETTRPARANLLQQQERFDAFVAEFNAVRPHEALDMKRPAEVFVGSSRPLPAKIPEFSYGDFDDVLRVSRYGELHVPGIGQISLTRALSGESVGVREDDNGRWLVNFCGLDLGYAGPAKKTFQPVGASTPSASHT
jgi:transposase InsO family protein